MAPLAALPQPLATVGRRVPEPLPAVALRPLIAEYTMTFGAAWGPVTRRKHADDFARFTGWLAAHERPLTTASLDFPTLVEYVTDLRVSEHQRCREIATKNAEASEVSRA